MSARLSAAQLLRRGGVPAGAVGVEGAAEAGNSLGILGRPGKPDEQREDLLLGQRLLRLAPGAAGSQRGCEVAEVAAQGAGDAGGQQLERLVQRRRRGQGV